MLLALRSGGREFRNFKIQTWFKQKPKMSIKILLRSEEKNLLKLKEKWERNKRYFYSEVHNTFNIMFHQEPSV